MGGMDIYVRNVVKGLAAGTKTVRPALTIFTVESQVESLRALAPEADFRVEPDHRSGLTLASEFDSKAHEVLFCPLLILDPMPADIPSAVMVPDLQHEFFPQFLDARMLELRRRTYRVSAARASRVFTLSEFSKRTLVDLYGLEPEKVVITYLDVDEDFRRGLPIAPSPAFSELALPDDYLLYPASFLRHKNHTALLRALKILLGTAHPTLGLVLTGPGPIEARVTDEIAKLELEKRVRLIGFQPRDVHVELYRHARALLFPSRFEGFGLPLLEAFHAQTPVISSRVAACPEIAGDAAVYFDENDPADIAAAVDRVLTDRELEADLIERGRKRAEQFSWEKTIEMTLKSLETLAAGR
ncbi:MAG: hypothetical protein QOE65_1735 [Solirubrobacteraceae bacterium]|nr:hypothetical protein [Solirubrobacteraceae bacterium]